MVLNTDNRSVPLQYAVNRILSGPFDWIVEGVDLKNVTTSQLWRIAQAFHQTIGGRGSLVEVVPGKVYFGEDCLSLYTYA